MVIGGVMLLRLREVKEVKEVEIEGVAINPLCGFQDCGSLPHTCVFSFSGPST
jgi:hypothetical protein